MGFKSWYSGLKYELAFGISFRQHCPPRPPVKAWKSVRKGKEPELEKKDFFLPRKYCLFLESQALDLRPLLRCPGTD